MRNAATASAARSKTTSRSGATPAPARRSARVLFRDEIVPIEIALKGKTTLVTADEGPAKFDEAKLRALKPAFGPEGTITAGNASSISDGAAALLVASNDARNTLKQQTDRTRFVGAATFSQEPEWFTTAPVGAIQNAAR